MKPKKVLMAMSGGIDSTVAAMLLQEQGYELIGVTYRTFDNISRGCLEKEKGCCSVDSLFEAKRMAEDMGFEHRILDIRKEFKDRVIANFIDEYLQGRTPNPCVVCNSTIKWGKLIETADEQGCDFIATGHYARIGKQGNRWYLRKGADSSKDQTYFLWTLTQENLARTLFPLGELTKPEVRKIAYDHGYEKLSRKGESQEICFIPDNDYRAFLTEQVENFAEKYGPGYFVDATGKKLGMHKGFPHYTIGQRKGLGRSGTADGCHRHPPGRQYGRTGHQRRAARQDLLRQKHQSDEIRTNPRRYGGDGKNPLPERRRQGVAIPGRRTAEGSGPRQHGLHYPRSKRRIL